MNLVTTNASQLESFANSGAKIRRAASSEEPMILTDIYREEINMVIWRRELSDTLKISVAEFLRFNPTFRASMTVTPQSALTSMADCLGQTALPELSENIAELVDMFCCLFDLKRTGLRLTALNQAMCPKFHVDRVPCRLISTYDGVATEWLPHHIVDRSKLGLGSKGLADRESGLYQHPQDIQRLESGDVALLKGELWEGNEDAGLVHRSPAPAEDSSRLLLTLDFSV